MATRVSSSSATSSHVARLGHHLGRHFCERSAHLEKQPCDPTFSQSANVESARGFGHSEQADPIGQQHLVTGRSGATS
jgi:hypothetical protein